MTASAVKFGVVLAALLAIGAGAAYGTRWEYREVKVGAASRSIRVNRWTGETERWDRDHWMEERDPVAGAVAPAL